MNITKSTQFYVKEIAIQSKGGPVSIKDLVEEVNFYDNLFMPVSSGEILITDAAKLLERLSPINDPIQFHICKTPKDEVGILKKIFRIYEISNRKNQNNNSETYVLHFVASEFTLSDQRKYSKGFKGTYSKMVQNVLTDKTNGLSLSPNDFKIEESFGIRKFTIANLPPLKAVEWCAKRALNTNNAPDFLFYSNMSGYNFVSLSNLLKQNPILDINFSPKNLSKNSGLSEMSQARGFEVISQADSASRIQSGVDAGVHIGFDPITGFVGQTPIDGDETYKKVGGANKNPIPSEIVNDDNTTNKKNFNAMQVLSYITTKQKNSNYIKEQDPTSISQNETLELFLQQRKAIISRLMEKRIRVVMPGNFQLSSGHIVNVITPGFGATSKQEDPNFDRSLGGKYLIVGTRHILSGNRHVTVIELATNSTNDTRKPSTTQSQKDALNNFDRNVKVNNDSSSYTGR
jgi:hypothetical protein